MINNAASLLSKQAMGGIIGEGGYSFQDRYIICKIPDLINDPNFYQLIKEGSGDLDTSYKPNGKVIKTYTQVKDHLVTTSEFRKILKQFKDKDKSSPSTFRAFTLVSLGLDPKVNKLKVALDRLRGIKNFYDQADNTKIQTDNDFKAIITDLKVGNDTDFILSKLYFESDLFGLKQIEPVIRIFCGGMEKIPQYQDYIKTFRSIFDPLHTYICSSTGKVIDRKELEDKLSDCIKKFKDNIKINGFSIRMFHWEDTPYELNLKHNEVVDWSKYFNRSKRQIASSKILETILIPQLIDIQQKVRKTGPVKLIKFEGNSCLSLGIAFGWAFPEVAGYTIELNQRLGSKSEIWRTDIISKTGYHLKHKDELISKIGSGLVVKFNVVADVTDQVKVFMKESKKLFKGVLTLEPEKGIGEFISNQSAVAYARDAKILIRNALSKYKTNSIHLFFAGPLGFAIFFGQLLNAMSDVQCYEQKIEGGYQLSCLLYKR